MKPMRILATLLMAIACALPAVAQVDETAKRFHVLALIADGSGWQSFVLVTNVAQSASLCTVELHGLGVDRFGDVIGVTATGSTATFELAGRGGNLVWSTRNESALASGYATLDCVAPVVAQVVLASIDESGATTGMAAVFSSQAGAVFQFPVLTADATVGFAIANDTGVDAACGIVLEDPQRVILGEAALLAPSKSNVARMLNAAIAIPETFHGGSATVSCDRRVAMIGVHFELQPDRAITTFNTLPLALLDTFPYPSDETAKRFHVLPHIADGSGWQSRLLVTNVARAASQCTVELHGLTVDRFEDAGGVTAAGTTATFELGGAGGYLVWGTRNESALASGYATLDCTAPVVAQVVFASIGDSGAPTGMATVFSSQPGAVFQFPVLTPAATLGFAIANDTNADAECRILLEDPQRMNLGEAAVSVPPKSSLEQMLNTAIAIPEGFLGGTARVGCNQQVAMTGIHMELAPNGDIITFNTLPPALLDPIRPTVTLSASAASIDLGEATTLTWSSTNAASATITPDIGEVDPSGSREMSPKVTTTYRITVTSSDGQTATTSVTVTVNVSERAVLMALYEATGGANWTNNTNWLTDRPLSEWFGVRVNGSGRVSLLRLRGNNLTGSIPPELGSLTGLTELYLDGNENLTGWIPPELGSLTHLTHVNLANNDLIGPLPPELGALVNLRELWLYHNNLSGSIPPELGDLTNLGELLLFGNELTGSIPPELGALVNLRKLQLGANKLTGRIPPELGSLTNLTNLHLGGNNLTGSIPPELGALTRLTSLWIRDSGLTGSIPRELGALSNLTGLYLAGNELTGTIPPELGSLTNLTSLQIQDNELTGSIPPELGALVNLTNVELSGNELTGSIPSELGALVNLRYLRLHNNDLIGPIPPELGALVNLTGLYLGNNNLTGSIPPELGSLANLQYLELHNNSLTGPIPREFLSLANLKYLYLRFNDGLCVPGSTDFVSWRRGITLVGGFCNDSDRAVLDALYEAAGGEDWTRSDGWGGDGALGEWYGVTVDALGRVTALDLSGNALTGHIPIILGRLSQLRELRLDGNALSGRLPSNLTRLPLQALHYADSGLCAPIEASFQAWLGDVASYEGTGVECGPLSDRDLLVALYNAVGGPAWTRSDNWLTDRRLSEWHGVEEVDDGGRVRVLHLDRNNLTGSIPPELGSLTHLTSLRIQDNELTGPIPPELGALVNLTNLELSRNALTGRIPRELGSLTNLTNLHLGGNYLTGSIPPELGALTQLTSLYLGDNNPVYVSGNYLTGSIPPELGALTNLTTLHLGGNNLTGSIPPELGALTNLTTLRLGGNNLTGSIPPELGALTRLVVLDLHGNKLTGPIPPELGALTRLSFLWLQDNELTGPIPKELGALAEIWQLDLDGNSLTGGIPSELGSLTRLTRLRFADNELNGPIPPELGALAEMRELDLDDNSLTGDIPSELGGLTRLTRLRLAGNELNGPIPPELGDLQQLRVLDVSRNTRMSGVLPASLTRLVQLEGFFAGDTGLCAPSDPGVQGWLDGVQRRRVEPCGYRPPVYLTQAVQSPRYPVPLVAGEEALLRVFVTAPTAGGARIPPVRARFYVDGQERHVLDISGSPALVPAGGRERSLVTSANAPVPADVVQPGLEWVVEIDPGQTLGPGVARRIPESGRWPVDVQAMPVFDLTVIPFLWSPDPDSAVVKLVEDMAADPDGHEMLWETRTLLPIADMAVTAHEPVWSSTNEVFDLVHETAMIRAMEGGAGHYMGMMTGLVYGPSGVGDLGGKSSFARSNAETIAHEFGHNLGLSHAPRGPVDPDPAYPYPDGSIGAWGYDFRDGGRLVSAATCDLMTYCSPSWISDYHFSNALRYRLDTEGGAGALQTAAPARSLLLWGGVDTAGAPFLEPAFVVEAPATLPGLAGEYRIIGRTANGEELFSLAFEMPEVADGDGGSSFAFTLPIEPGWAEELAGVTLSGPGGAVTLDEDTDRPVTILRNPQTGQVRGVLRDRPEAGAAPALAPGVRQAPAAEQFALPPDADIEALTSRGLPDPEDWR